MMHLERWGRGEDAYFALHGWGGTHLTFAPLSKHLPTHASLFAADLPGYGRSSRPSQWSAQAVTDEIVDTLERLQLTKVTVIGNCSGALFALLVALQTTTRVTRLVLVDPFAFIPWYFQIFVHPVYGEVAYRSTFANPLGRWITNAALHRHRESDSDLTGSFADIDHAVSLRYLHLLNSLGGIDRFHALRVPIDLVYGHRTFAAVRQSIARWQGLWPDATVREIAGAGHLPLEEAPAAMAAVIFRPPALSHVEGPALSHVEGPALSHVEASSAAVMRMA